MEKMKIDDVKNVCVVGAGNMGHQISLLCAIYGYKTKCSDVVPEMLKKADNFVNNYLPGRVEKGKMTKEVGGGGAQKYFFYFRHERSR